jgi:hypothetical protein
MSTVHAVPEEECWVHPAIEVRQSPLGGMGLFATERICRGELVARLGGWVVDTAQLHKLFETSATYVDSIILGEDEHLVLPPRRTIGYGNHSCDPNLWWEGPFSLVARRNIEVGEEVTNDYCASTTEPDFTMDCRCGTSTCRGTIRGTDAGEHQLSALYEGHVVPAVAEASR